MTAVSLVGNSEKEHKVPLQHGDLLKLNVELLVEASWGADGIVLERQVDKIGVVVL